MTWRRILILATREVQLARFRGHGTFCNAQMSGRELREVVNLDEPTLALLERAMASQGLSARAFDRISKAARMIADLAGSPGVSGDHVSEAIQYRSLDKSMWRQ